MTLKGSGSMRSVVAVLLLALVAAGPAVAGEPTDQLRQQIDKVLGMLQDPQLAGEGKTAERHAALRTAADQIFAVDETARRALGRHWNERTPAEREEFVKLFGDLLERAYVGRIEQYTGEKVTFAGDAVDGDQATVRTRIVTKKGSEVPVDYRMIKRQNGRWMIYDVVIEGVSLISNYRTQFTRIIESSSYGDLVARLKTRGVDPPPASPRGGKS